MPGMMENVATLNSVVRTVLALAFLGIIAASGFVVYQTYNAGDIAKNDLKKARQTLDETSAELKSTQVKLQENRNELAIKLRELSAKETQIANQQTEIIDLNKTIAEMTKVIEKQATAMRLLKKDYRLAIATVLDQKQVDKEIVTTIRWVEVDDDDQPIGEPRTFDLKGDIVKVDAWVVKFNDDYIEKADLIRGTSICLFRRVHGEFPQPDEVHTLDEVGSPPNAYRRGGRVSDFEREIWDDFWKIANNPVRAEELGIRAAHGEVVYQKVKRGMKYKLELRSSGGLTMKPLGESEPDPTVKPSA